MALLLVAGFGSWAVDHRLTERCLMQAPLQAEGIVTDKWQRSGRGGTTYTLAYRFTDRGGVSHDGSQRTGSAQFHALGPGSSLRVQLCATNPSRHVLSIQQLRQEIRGLTFATIASALAFVGYITFIMWQAAVSRWNASPPASDDDERWSSTANRHPRHVGR